MAGTYFLDATFGQCVVREYFEVILSDYPTISPLGIDTSICEGTSLNLMAATDLGTISWQDGSSENDYEVTEAGLYFYQADNQGCISSDTIAVMIIDLPELDLDGNYSECEGEVFTLTTSVNADSYSWSNGDSGPTFSSILPGSYSLIATIGECQLIGAFNLDFQSPPFLDLGPDQTLCSGEVVILDASLEGIWQDGSMSTEFTVESSGLYFVEVTEGECSSRDSVLVDFLPSPVFSLGADSNCL